MLQTVLCALAIFGFGSVHAGNEADSATRSARKKIQQLVFSEQHIEGKIRRPQVVLIKAEQRPTFTPMAIQSLGGATGIVECVPQEVIDYSPYSNAFRFEGTEVSNCSP
jgi:hypothetical protein